MKWHAVILGQAFYWSGIGLAIALDAPLTWTFCLAYGLLSGIAGARCASGRG